MVDTLCAFFKSFDSFFYRTQQKTDMIRFRLAELMEKRQFDTGRRVTIGEVAAATGLNRMTLSKILNQKGYSTGTDTVDRLCAFFKCRVEDLMEHVPEGP